MNIVSYTSKLGNSDIEVRPAHAAFVARLIRNLITGNFGYFGKTQSTHTLSRECYKHHINTASKTRNRVGNPSKGNRRKFLTRAVTARLAASKAIDWYSVPVVWNEISQVSMTEWREVPSFLKCSWYISAYMKEHGQRYCAFTLNIGKELLVREDWSNQTPAEIKALKNRMRERLKTAIPEQYERMFAIELDNAGRPHIHGIVFGCTSKQLEQYRVAIKKAGGKWSGKDSNRQLVTKQRQNFDEAIGWMSYSTKDSDDYMYVPQNIRDNGKAHYIATKQKIEERQASNQTDVQSVVMAPAEIEVLENTAPVQSMPDNIRHPISKLASEPAEEAICDSSGYGNKWGVF